MNESTVSNSTEKLLDTIRGKDVPPAGEPEKSVPKVRRMRQETSIKSHMKQSLTAGVHISDKHISLVLTGRRKHGADRELVKWAHLEIPDLMDITSPRFASFFRSTLAEFMGRHKNAEVWTAIDSRDLKLRNLNIPDVPDAKMANAALWGFKKDVEVDSENEIFDFEFIEDTHVNGIKKKNVVAFSGNKKQILFLKQLFAGAGFPLTGITTLPFAMQNFIRTHSVEVGPVPLILVNVVRYHSEITCLSDEGVLLTRHIKTGSASLVEELLHIGDEETKDADISDILGSGLTLDSAEFAAMEPAASRLLDKINRTGDYCSNNFAANEPISKFVFFGETDNCDAFIAYAARQIPNKVEKLSVFEDASLSLAIQMPAGAPERSGVIPALGLALSTDSRTPNFLYTYLEKAIRARYRKMNLAVAAAGIVCLAVLAGVWGWFDTQKNAVLKETAAMEQQLAQYTPAVTRQALAAKISAARKKAEAINQYAGDFLPLAVIHEICALTPEHIDIISLDSVFTAQSAPDALKTGTGKTKKRTGSNNDPGQPSRTVTIKGIVDTAFIDLEPALTGYVIHLGNSPLFGDILLTEKQVIEKTSATILAFTADMEIR